MRISYSGLNATPLDAISHIYKTNEHAGVSFLRRLTDKAARKNLKGLQDTYHKAVDHTSLYTGLNATSLDVKT